MRRRWDRPYLLLLLLCAGQRLAELWLSRRNILRSGTALGTAGRRTFPLMVMLHLALFAAPLAERRIRPRRDRPARIAPALALGAAATALRLWVIRTLGAGWNARAMVPATLEVVDSGPYRWIRHPNYVAVAAEMAALPLAGSAPLSAAALSAANALILTERIRTEERLLAQIPAYLARMGHKPRFVPRLPGGQRAVGAKVNPTRPGIEGRP
ncbi:MAG TPA: isoprenylcysteine carboxylmethyltransferase family protein [Dehalococcoidia bacterium]|nr:isoprenylcysteine carboxylmethyltransferase family protein [Dehalococcoidia bacterium]